MHSALILAAGMGSRLAPITDSRPKCMVEVNGEPILFRQIECLRSNSVRDIYVMAGYRADMLNDSVKSRYPDVNVLVIPEYASTNNMHSAWSARKFLAGKSFLMMNADVFMDPSVIGSLINCEADNAIVVENGAYYEESMKVVVSEGRIRAISKTITEAEAYGTSIDVYKFSKAAGEAFFKKCTEYIEEKGQLKLWSEVALNDILSDVNFSPCPLKGRWFEIDTLEDLDRATKVFASK